MNCRKFFGQVYAARLDTVDRVELFLGILLTLVILNTHIWLDIDRQKTPRDWLYSWT